MPDDMQSLDIKNAVSAEEWRARVDCAMLYRLTALHGWDDMIFTHISHRIPGPEHHFLINPYGRSPRPPPHHIVRSGLSGAAMLPELRGGAMP